MTVHYVVVGLCARRCRHVPPRSKLALRFSDFTTPVQASADPHIAHTTLHIERPHNHILIFTLHARVSACRGPCAAAAHIGFLSFTPLYDTIHRTRTRCSVPRMVPRHGRRCSRGRSRLPPHTLYEGVQGTSAGPVTASGPQDDRVFFNILTCSRAPCRLRRAGAPAAPAESG